MHTTASSGPDGPDFAAVYRDHHSFVWRTLRHLGVEPARIDDAVQDTFLVVHRRLHEFAGRAALRTWLFEIARRVAADYRRTAAREAPRRQALTLIPELAANDDPGARTEAAQIVQLFLDQLDRDKSVVFILAELEDWRAPEIAEELDLNLNTVYARLRAARKELDRLVGRLRARDHRIQARTGAAVLAACALEFPPAPPAWIVPARPAMFMEPWLLEPVSLTSKIAGAAAGRSLVSAVVAAGLGLGVVLAVAPAREPRTREPAAAHEARLVAPASPVTGSPAPATMLAATASPEPATMLAATASPAPATARAGSPGAPALAAPPVSSTSQRNAPSLAEELALVESIRAALLADDRRAVLTLAARHRRRFPAGAFLEETAAAAIEARCRLGEVEAARRDADAFAHRWPDSPLVHRVTTLCL